MELDLATSLRLDEKAVFPLLSEYFRLGDRFARKDVFDIVSVDVQGPVALSRLRMLRTFVSSTDPGGFHLSGPVAYEMVAQLNIIHGLTLLGQREKKSEVWGRSFAIESVRPVRDPADIVIRTEVKRDWLSKKRPDLLGLEFAFSIADGAMTGAARTYFETRLKKA